MKRTFDFMGTARIWIAISVVILLVGLVSLFTRGVNLSIDYTGGTQLELQFSGDRVVVGEVTKIVTATTGRSATVKASTVKGDDSGSTFLVQTGALDLAQRQELFQALKAELGEFEVLAMSEVSGSIRSELILNGLMAVGIAAVLQVIYLAFRFEYRFAVSAIVALLHDLLLVFGLVSLLGIEIGPSFLAAVLTILGYSVNDTIIIFDRIRENLRRKSKTETLPALVNRSISETISRTIYTGLTTLTAVGAILFFGGASTRDFAGALALGIILGTYSSILIASPIWAWWRQSDTKSGRPAIAK